MTDGTFQPDAKSQELLSAGLSPDLVKEFQSDRAVTANIEAERALREQGFTVLSPEDQELASQGFTVQPKAEFREVLTPAQRQAATQTMAERNAAQRAAALPSGFKEVDPLDVYTDDELLKQPDFNPEDYFRKHQVAIESNPTKFARFTELYRKSKQRGLELGKLGKGALKTAGEILASPYGLLTYASKAAGGEAGPATVGEAVPRMLTNLGRTVVTGLQAGPGAVVGDIAGTLADETYTGASEASKRPAAEALAGTVADAASLALGLKNAGEKALRVTHITKPWQDMTPQEVQGHLRAAAANKQAMEELSRGETVALEPTTTELAAAGTPIRPEEVARAQEGGLASWLGYGKLFEGIHAGAASAKKWVNNTAAGRLAGDLEAARGGFEATAREAKGFATAENAAKLRAAERELAMAEEAVKASPTATALDAVTRAKAALAELTQKAAAGTVEKAGQALQLPERLLHKIPGVSTFGTVAGMFTGGLPGLAKTVAARAGAMAAQKAGQAVENIGAQAAPGVSRTVAMSRAADMAKAFNDSVGKALGPGGLGMDVAFSTALAPEGETPQEIGAFMGTMRLFHGLPVGLRRVVGGELVSRRPLTQEVAPDPAYGQNPVLDSAHVEGMKLAGQDVQDRVNFIRALGRKLGGQLYLISPDMAPDVLVEAYRQKGVPITREQAAGMVQGGVFKMDLPDRDGNPQRIVFAFDPASVAHEVGHLIQSVLPESVNRSIDALIGSEYTPQEFENFAADYTRRLLGVTPEEVANGGWRALLEEKQVVPDYLKGIVQNDPTGVHAYIVRELGAENMSKSFGSAAEGIGEKPDLYRRIAFGISGLASSLGVNLLGETPLGAAVQPRVMKAQEIALSDILASPTRQAVVEVEARRAGARKTPGAPTPREEKAITRSIEQATDTPPPADAVVPAAEAQNARQITEIIADAIRKGGGMLKAWYRTAPGATDAALSSAAPVSEVKARQAAIEAARTIPEAERPLWERLFFAYGLSPSSRGPQVKTWNPLVFAANAVRWAKALQAAGAVAESPYPIVNGELTPDGWRQLRNDLQVASRNYLAGYGASGVELGGAVRAEDFKAMVEGAGYRVPEKTTPSPEQLPQERADVINYLLAPDTTPKTARVAAGPQIPMNVIGQKVSEATIPGRVSPIAGAPVYQGEAARAKGVEGVAVAEVNPFRAKMRQLGVKPELFSVLQKLNVEHLAKVEPAPEQPVVASNILTAAGGFMPRTDLIGGQFSPEVTRDDVPKIRAAGLRDKETGKLYAGFMHAMAFDRVFDELGAIDGVTSIEDVSNPNFSKVMDRFEQGFLVQDPDKPGFRFVDRAEGAKIGEASGQLRRAVQGGELDSEDVNFNGQASPVAENVRDLATMTRDEFERGPRGFRGRFGGGASAWAMEQGAEAKDQSDAAAMRSTYEALRLAANEAMSSGQADLAMDYITRAQTAREAYETATGEMIDGRAGEPGALHEARKRVPDFQPPLGAMVRPLQGQAMPYPPASEFNKQVEEQDRRILQRYGAQRFTEPLTQEQRNAGATVPKGHRIEEGTFSDWLSRQARKSTINYNEPAPSVMDESVIRAQERAKIGIPLEFAGQMMPATSSFGKRLEEEGYEFRRSGQVGIRGVSVFKDGGLVGEITSAASQGTPDKAYVAGITVDPDFRRQGLGEALYRELANTLQDDGIKLLGGMVVSTEPLGIRERVFGDTGIATTAGEGLTVPEAQDFIRASKKANRPFFVEANNFIRPKAEGQYSPPEKKEHPDLFGGYRVGKGGQVQGESMLRDNILDAVSTWQAKGTVDQLKKHLDKFGGTKEEAQWTGLNAWLADKQARGESVTKGEVEDFIVKNQIQLEEVTLTEGEHPSWSEGEMDTEWGGTLPTWDLYRGDTGDSYGSVNAEAENEGALREAYDNETEMPEPDIVYVAYSANGRRLGKFQTPEMAQSEVEDRYSPEPGEGEAQYAKWTLPGGRDYREVLVKLPNFPTPPEVSQALEEKEAFRAAMVEKYGSWQDFRDKGSPNEKQKLEDLRRESSFEGYESPHFDDNKNNENLIAHMRVTDRRTLDDQRLYFLEEIQSDLHQEGAKSGYASEVMSLKDRERYTELHDLLNRIGQGMEVPPEDYAKFNLDPNMAPQEAQQLKEEAYARYETERKASRETVPDAPFKGASWKKLLLKRAIIAAAEEGADALGWTTGEMQRKRYNLAKFIGSITYHKEPDGTYSAEFWKKGEEPGSSGSALAHEVMNVPLSKIAELAGEDIAKQMEAGAGAEKPYSSTADMIKRGKALEVFNEGETVWKLRFENGETHGVWLNEGDAQRALENNNAILENYKINPRRELTPEDFSLGGKGKLNLYDREMVNLANELGKKYGAKVEMKLVKVPGEDAQAVWTLPVTDALRKQVKDVGFAQFSPKPERRPNEQGFFSAAKRTLEDKMPNRASAQQVRAILSPSNGVKAEELKWTGLDDYLKEAEAAKKPIEKADILKFTEENAVQIAEHWKATRETRAATMPPGTYPETGPKWQRYKQPGGKFYRELVWSWENPKGRADRVPFYHRQHWGNIRNPLAHARVTDRYAQGKHTLFVEELQSDLHQKGRNAGYYNAAETKREEEKSKLVSTQASKVGNIAATLGSRIRQLLATALGGGSEMNWEELNKLGREDEYKELLQEKGRAESVYKSFVSDEKQKDADVEEARVKYEDALDRYYDFFRNRIETTGENMGAIRKAIDVIDQAEKLDRRELKASLRSTFAWESANEQRKIAERVGKRPPEAPFSKSWREVFFRRLVNYAARMGYDAVSWTTGAQQAALYEYSMRQAVDDISWQPAARYRSAQAEEAKDKTARNPAGSFTVTAKKNGMVVFQHTFERDGTPVGGSPNGEEGTTLDDVVGESMANKMKAEPEGKISGEHLAVGAKWMQEVYDMILPEYARKFGKKFGAKVEILPHGAATEFRQAPLRPGVPREHPGLFEPVDVQTRRAKVQRSPKFTAWSMEITPEMRKSVVETGTAQFSPKAAPAGSEFKIEPVKTAWGEFPNAVMHTSVVALQKHPDYEAAKAGDPEAAIRVARSLVKPDRAAALAANFPGAKLLPVRADEARGRNALPSALAVTLSAATGLDIATGIVQASRAHHTGASDVERVERRAEFAGPVEEGGKYILLDDVSTSGSTLAALRAFIRRNGGEVVGISVFGAAHRPDRGHGSHVALREDTLAELKKLDKARLSGILQRYGLENIEDLSNGEARIILREARKPAH